MALEQLLNGMQQDISTEATGLSRVSTLRVARVNGKENVLPWANRDNYKWRESVSKEEVTRLFYLASLEGSYANSHSDGYSHGNGKVHHVEDIGVAIVASSEAVLLNPPSWVEQWHLRVPLDVYWEGNIPAMMRDLENARVRDDDNKTRVQEDDRDLANSAARVFKNPQLYPYLMATRLAIKIRNGLSRKYGSVPATFDMNEQRALLSGVDFSEIPDLHRSYQDLIEVFYPSIKRFAHYKASRSRSDQDEWEGIAGVNLALAASNFYWETMAINPKWTAARFLKTAYKSIQDPMAGKFDTHTLEVSTEAMGRYESPYCTEVEVLQNLSKQYVKWLIETSTQVPEEAEVLNLRIFNNLSYPQVAQQLGIPKKVVAQIVTKFRARVRPLVKEGDPNVPSGPKTGVRVKPFWDNLFANVAKYKAQFDERRAMLKPFHELMVEKFFELQTGDRDTTIQAVWQSFQAVSWDITLDTIRRAISAGINQMDYREKPDNRAHGQLAAGWSRHQQAELVLEAAKDPSIWDAFSDQRKFILERYFIEGGGRRITAAKIADELGLHESTISREIDRGIREIYRLSNHIQYRGGLAYKPRNLLPA